MTSLPRAAPHSVARPRPRPRAGAIASYGEGRTCLEPECQTLLSRYNKDQLCWKHADERERIRNQPRP